MLNCNIFCLMEIESKEIIIKYINNKTPKCVREKRIKDVSDFLKDLDCDYPKFDDWLLKVINQIDSGKRIILVKYDDECKVEGVAILKNCKDEKKICTLRVRHDKQRMGIGTLLIQEAIEVLNDSKPLITVSEHHINEFTPIFKKFKFKRRNIVDSLYNQNIKEYFFNKPYFQQSILMSIKPEFSSRILSGIKTVEFRKIFNNQVKRIFIYSTSPECKIVGYIIVEDVVKEPVSLLWKNYNEKGGICRKAFFDYFKNHEVGYAIKIGNIKVFNKPIDPKSVFVSSFRAPQNYMYVDGNIVRCILKMDEMSDDSKNKWLSE